MITSNFLLLSLWFILGVLAGVYARIREGVKMPVVWYFFCGLFGPATFLILMEDL